MTPAPWELPCPNDACSHAQCAEQQFLAAELERLRAELAKRAACDACTDRHAAMEAKRDDFLDREAAA